MWIRLLHAILWVVKLCLVFAWRRQENPFGIVAMVVQKAERQGRKMESHQNNNDRALFIYKEEPASLIASKSYPRTQDSRRASDISQVIFFAFHLAL